MSYSELFDNKNAFVEKVKTELSRYAFKQLEVQKKAIANDFLKSVDKGDEF